ncbi:hypothetical protein RhiirA1_131610 [Rhizophagus irregularis]|uniref:Uncharacterized protein n=1 Tax=Rhizophagus irregularis TaxID=588596 RepID=A0A2N0S0V6_9GLOM|nr:hypothetical protein RhiirA1_131610 [Rhizophagus irregularis]
MVSDCVQHPYTPGQVTILPNIVNFTKNVTGTNTTNCNKLYICTFNIVTCLGSSIVDYAFVPS